MMERLGSFYDADDRADRHIILDYEKERLTFKLLERQWRMEMRLENEPMPPSLRDGIEDHVQTRFARSISFLENGFCTDKATVRRRR